MGFIEVICDSLTAFRSNVEGKSSTDTPLFSFGQGWKNIVGIKVQEVTIPISWYNWRVYGQFSTKLRTDRQFLFNLGTSSEYFTMLDSLGNSLTFNQGLTYSAPSFAAAMTTYLNSTAFTNALTAKGLTGPYTNNCFFNNSTNTFTFSIVTSGAPVGAIPFINIVNEDPFAVETGNGRSLLATMLGLQMGINNFEATVNGYKLTTGVVNMGGFNTLFLCSRTLGPLCTIQPNYQTIENAYNYNVQDSSEHVAHIPINANYSDILVWQAPDRTGYYEISNLNNLNAFDFYLTFGPLITPIELNGQGFQVKLLLEQSIEALAVENKVKRRKYY